MMSSARRTRLRHLCRSRDAAPDRGQCRSRHGGVGRAAPGRRDDWLACRKEWERWAREQAVEHRDDATLAAVEHRRPRSAGIEEEAVVPLHLQKGEAGIPARWILD